jgi:hypothetical protein
MSGSGDSSGYYPKPSNGEYLSFEEAEQITSLTTVLVGLAERNTPGFNVNATYEQSEGEYFSFGVGTDSNALEVTVYGSPEESGILCSFSFSTEPYTDYKHSPTTIREIYTLCASSHPSPLK